MTILMMPMVEGTQARPFKAKKIFDILPASTAAYDADTIFPLVSGNVYWFEFHPRFLCANSGTNSSWRLSYSGTISYATAFQMNRPNLSLETSVNYSVSAIAWYPEDGSTMTSPALLAHGTTVTFVAQAFGSGWLTGVIAPSSDGLLAITHGINGTGGTPRGVQFATARVEQLN